MASEGEEAGSFTREFIARARVFPPRVDPPERSGDAVILLHGLGRTRRSLALMERALRGAGYVVVNCGYPSKAAEIETLADVAVGDGLGALPRRREGGRIHFVTHSMGAILLRAWFRPRGGGGDGGGDGGEYGGAGGGVGTEGYGRAVLLGPPNRGSEIVEAFARAGLDRTLLGPAGADLGVGDGAAPARLPPLPLPHGVIAGRRSINPFGGALFSGPSDGLVSVESALATDADDRIVLPVTHTLMMNEPMTIWQTARFLRAGTFDHAARLDALEREPPLT